MVVGYSYGGEGGYGWEEGEGYVYRLIDLLELIVLWKERGGGSGEAESRCSLLADNAIASGENCTRSYFRTRHAHS